MERPQPQFDAEKSQVDQLRRTVGEVIYARELATDEVIEGVSHGVHDDRVWIKTQDGVLDSYPIDGWHYTTSNAQSNGYHTI